MLTLFFSGTGNTEYIARAFSQKMQYHCLSIEDEADFPAEIAAADTLAICYPIYGSRVPLIMREFVARHMDIFRGKKLVILVTQLIFSGDGARVLCDIFPAGHVEVIYGRVEAQRLTISLWQVFGTAPSEPDGHLSMYPALRLLLNR
ncbi:MAG: flavodoxin domain-containing protein [Defluviitaleaceae bacterium]|nr:flavodoxin domain-containing protein [Defluviitaleaceae bacterium]